MIISFINNLSLLLAMSICHSFLIQKVEINSTRYKIISGLLFGVTAIAGMMNPYVLIEGIIFDGRSLVASLAGLFGGPITAAIVVIIGGAYRIMVGGAGTITGITVLIITGGLGVVYYYLNEKNYLRISNIHLYVFGIIVHIFMLLCMLTIPSPETWRVLKTISLPVMIIFPVGTFLLGKLLYDQQCFRHFYKKLQESEERYRTLFENDHTVMLLVDPENGTIIDANPAACHFYGYSREKIKTLNVDHINTLDASEIKKEMQKAKTKKKNAFSFKHRLANGEIRDVEVYSGGITINGQEVLYSLIFDVTDRKALEQSLKESEERFRLALSEMPFPVNIHDETGKIHFINKVWTELTGYTHDEIPTIEAWTLKAYGEKHKDVKKRIRDLYSWQSRVDGGEFYITTKRGDMRIWEFSAAPLGKDSEGNQLVISVARDITEERKLQKEYEENRQILVTAMDQSQAGIAIAYAPSGQLRYVNQSGLMILGKSREKALYGVDIQNYVSEWELYDLSSWPLHEDEVPLARAVKYGETSSREFIIRRSEEDERIVYANAAPITNQDGTITAAVVVFLDITEQKQAEMQRQKLTTAIEQSQEIFVITDTEGIIEYVNPAFEKITGYTKEEVMGKTSNILKSGEQDEDFYTNLWETIGEGKNWSGEFINKKKDGSSFYEKAMISPVFDSNGKIVHYVAVKSDVTKEKQLEEQLLQSQKMESIGHLAGGVAHDFNNILTALIGYCGFAQMKAAKDDPIQEDLKQIEKSSERAIKLTRQLLAFSRKQILQPEIIDLNELILNIDKMLRRLIEEDIEYKTLPYEGLWKIFADPGQIEQILINLAVNARDAMPTGGKLVIETRNVFLDEEYASHHAEVTPGEYVMVAVSDSGTGIDDNILDKIFDPFFTTKERGKGTGLGLSTVHGIVKQSGGHIYVYSEEGKGSTFKVYFPRIQHASERKSSQGGPPILPFGEETILLVEDDPMVCQLIERTLRGAGYHVITSSHGSEAIPLFEKHHEFIHLLITDVVMPLMGGKELSEELRKRDPSIKTLFISGYTDNAIVHYGILEEGIKFLQKPFTNYDLLQKVRSVLDES